MDEHLPSMVTSLPVDHRGSYVHLCGNSVPDTKINPLLFIHDINQQSDDFQHLLKICFTQECSSYVYDLRGHGRSGNLLGHVRKFDDHISDLLQVTSWIKHLENRRSPVLVGYGLGALVANDFARKFSDSLSGLALVSPLNELKSPPFFAENIFIKAMSELWPMFRMRTPRFPQHRSVYQYQLYTVRYLSEIYQAIERFETRFIDYSGDILLICPEQNQFYSYQKLKKSVALFKEQKLTQIDLNCDHFLFDVESQNLQHVMKIILEWVNKISVEEFSSDGVTPISKNKNRKLSLAVDSA